MSLVVPFEEIFAEESRVLARHSSWERVELGEVCSILNGFPFKSSLFNGVEGFPIIRIRDIAASATRTFYRGCVEPEYVVHAGDILIGMDGNFQCFEWRGIDAGLNQRVCKILPDSRFLNRKFLLFGLNGYLYAIQCATSSVTVGHLSSRDIQRIPFPLPPINEQCRIAAKLEQALTKIDASNQRLAKIPILLKRFRQSVLAAACSGRLTADWREDASIATVVPPVVIGSPPRQNEASGWRWRPLTELAVLESGHTPRKTVPAYWEGGDVPWISLQDIRRANGSVIHNTLQMPTLTGIENSSARLLPAGTVVFSRDISVGFVTVMGRAMATSQHFANWVCRNELNNRFLMYALMASRDHLLASGQGSTVQTIYMPALKEFQLLTPPLPEQHEIVRRVDALFKLADEIEARFEKAKAQIEKLMPALLAKAFRGELVPQDPNDEPASVLLARIRAERAADTNGAGRPQRIRKRPTG